MMDAPPYVVLMGDVGTGKSTLIEKLTGCTGISSDNKTSVTDKSDIYWLPNKSMLIYDTPGSNAMADKFRHNCWIVAAINYQPVSRIVAVVKADTRIDNVVEVIRKYAESFLSLPQMLDVFAACVTHMDTVKWEEQDLIKHVKAQLGFETVIFSGLYTPPETVTRDLHRICTGRFNLEIKSDDFLKIFKISDGNLKILYSTKKEVNQFKKVYDLFKVQRMQFSGKEQIDLIFEFQAWMEDMIEKAKQRVAEENGFTFHGENMPNEAGHIANMTNQLRIILFDVRTEVLGYQSHHGVSAVKKCPHCGQIWAKVVGCEGKTTCGARVGAFDVRSSEFGVLATFSFTWDGESLGISRTGQREAGMGQRSQTDGKGVGCGASIIWSEMPPATLPPEFCEQKPVSVDDVNLLPEQAEKPWRQRFGELTQQMKESLTKSFGRASSTREDGAAGYK